MILGLFALVVAIFALSLFATVMAYRAGAGYLTRLASTTMTVILGLVTLFCLLGIIELWWYHSGVDRCPFQPCTPDYLK